MDQGDTAGDSEHITTRQYEDIHQGDMLQPAGICQVDCQIESAKNGKIKRQPIGQWKYHHAQHCGSCQSNRDGQFTCSDGTFALFGMLTVGIHIHHVVNNVYNAG